MAKSLSQSGFTLLEVLISLLILSVSLLAVSGSHNVGMVRSRLSEETTIAAMLARYQLHEIQLELEEGIAKGEFPSDNKSMEGDFDDVPGGEKYQNFKWRATVNKVELPVPPEPEATEQEEAGTDVMLKIFKIVAEQIGESAREIKLTVYWDDLGEERALSATTHIVRL